MVNDKTCVRFKTKLSFCFSNASGSSCTSGILDLLGSLPSSGLVANIYCFLLGTLSHEALPFLFWGPCNHQVICVRGILGLIHLIDRQARYYTHTHTHTHTHTYTYKYTYINKYKHTYIHQYTHTEKTILDCRNYTVVTFDVLKQIVIFVENKNHKCPLKTILVFK
jgi:hypothetical protein